MCLLLTVVKSSLKGPRTILCLSGQRTLGLANMANIASFVDLDDFCPDPAPDPDST